MTGGTEEAALPQDSQAIDAASPVQLAHVTHAVLFEGVGVWFSTFISQ